MKKEIYRIDRGLYSDIEWYDIINKQEDLPYLDIVIDPETETAQPDYISVFDVDIYNLFHENLNITNFYVLSTFLQNTDTDFELEEAIYNFVNNADSFTFEGIGDGFRITKEKNKKTTELIINV